VAVAVCALLGFGCSEPSKGPFTFKLEDIPDDVQAGGEAFTIKVTVGPTRASTKFQPSAYEFDLKFDPAVLRADSVERGGYLAGIGREALCPEGGNTIDNEKGIISVACASLSGGDKGKKSDALALITFSPVGSGRSALEFVDEEFADRLGESLLTKAQDGEIRVE
jgi:hypothetical protein